MTRRFIALPIAFAALTALTACGQEDPFADKTYKNCLEVDSITFRADGVLTATKDGGEVACARYPFDSGEAINA